MKRLTVILHSLADAGEVDDDVDTILAKCFTRTYARNHEELWALEYAGRDDDLLGRIQLRLDPGSDPACRGRGRRRRARRLDKGDTDRFRRSLLEDLDSRPSA